MPTGGLPTHEGILVVGIDPGEEYVTPAGWPGPGNLRQRILRGVLRMLY